PLFRSASVQLNPGNVVTDIATAALMPASDPTNASTARERDRLAAAGCRASAMAKYVTTAPLTGSTRETTDTMLASTTNTSTPTGRRRRRASGRAMANAATSDTAKIGRAH